MSVTYHQLIRELALRTNSLVGPDEATLEASYNTNPLTESQFDGADFPFTAHKDAILDAEEEFAWAIADAVLGRQPDGRLILHPWRTNISSTLTAVTSPTNLPAVDSTGNKIIGAYGAIYDSSDGLPLKPATADRILRTNRLATGMPVYEFCIDGRRITHTRTQVVIEVCVYNRATQLTTLNANGAILLPDVTAPGIVARAAGFMTRDDALAEQAKIYRAYGDEALNRISKGLMSAMPRLPLYPAAEVA